MKRKDYSMPSKSSKGSYMNGEPEGRVKRTYMCPVEIGKGFAEVKPLFQPGSLGYSQQAFDYKY